MGRRFLDDLEVLFRRLDRFPQLGRGVLPGIQQAPPSRFPYNLYYSLHERGAEVLAVAHFARHEWVWRRRVEDED